jgi:hypothetical protein
MPAGKGRALVDRELYLPKAWVADPAGRVEAHVSEQVGVATKPKLAQGMSPMCWRSRPLSRCGRPESRVRRRSQPAIAGLPARAWRRLSAGDGAKAPPDP